MERILDWENYLETAAETVAEGIVLLKNENKALPLDPAEEIAVFGRIQLHYYKSGTGSGGMVNVSRVVSILDGLQEQGIQVNEQLLDVYKKWDSEHPFELGEGWGQEPWSQEEMPLDAELVKQVAASCKTAIVIIGRTAGEEQDNRLKAGSYLLAEAEKEMLTKVREAFEKVIVVLNVGNIIDMEYLEQCGPDAILYAWQGGMTGGTGTARVLNGEVSPSGKLPDTIAYQVADYPSAPYFGGKEKNYYTEDIYVGYRYFETFAREKVRYPFGYGLSYTKFIVHTNHVEHREEHVHMEVSVENCGAYAGKEVVQVYLQAPQGKLGKADRVLCAYKKTKRLEPGETQVLSLDIFLEEFASYDDSGVTGHRFCYVLESGTYNFYLGTDVCSARKVYSIEKIKDIVISQQEQALAPVESFERMHPLENVQAEAAEQKQSSENVQAEAAEQKQSSENVQAGETGQKQLLEQAQAESPYQVTIEKVPTLEIDEEKRRLQDIPQEIVQTGDQGFKLEDVIKGKCTLEAFIAQLTDEDLACIIRGEGMNSPRVTAGTASAFGGVSRRLQEFGIPCGCCSDGPSGMRLDCGTRAFSLPNGTLLASTFNTELVEKLYGLVGQEMAVNKVDCLLGPGMNIHRHPLNGRNFEYFSEDPYVTGTMAAAQLRGMHRAGVTGTIKHFCGNNQETDRHSIDSVVSERALREIYLKGFEIAVKEGAADSIMTTYGSVNGLWTAGSYDLNTQILRKEWGFTGFVMTDWWANINERGKAVDKGNFAAMAKAQNDVYMVCADGEKHEDNTLASLADGTLTRAELQRNAMNICRFLMHTHAMERVMGEEKKWEIIHRPEEEGDAQDSEVIFYPVDWEITIPLQDICTDKGTSYCFALDISNAGYYEVTLTASSEQSELAQIPVTLFNTGTASGTFTWNGTGGQPVSFTKEMPIFSRFSTMRLYFAQSGLHMESITFRWVREQDQI